MRTLGERSRHVAGRAVELLHDPPANRSTEVDVREIHERPVLGAAVGEHGAGLEDAGRRAHGEAQVRLEPRTEPDAMGDRPVDTESGIPHREPSPVDLAAGSSPCRGCSSSGPGLPIALPPQWMK